jgi:(p)ppGpp synthase/HD superfamily hydrolase
VKAAPAYSPKFDEAVALAIDAFRDKYRKSTRVPYVTHLLMVCAIVGEHGGDEEQMIAAILHDYLEDVEGASADEVERRFGPRVRHLVLALSDTTVHPKPPWRERKEKYLAHLRDEPAEVKLISAADKLHNCRTIVADHHVQGERIFERFTAPKHETLWYFRAVLAALRSNWQHPILKDLDDAVVALHRVSEVPLQPPVP